MPLTLSRDRPTLLIRRASFERAGLVRTEFDQRLNLTPDEFCVEENLVAIGPVHDEEQLGILVAELEARGLVWFEDIFELSGNWPEWLSLYARAT